MFRPSDGTLLDHTVSLLLRTGPQTPRVVKYSARRNEHTFAHDPESDHACTGPVESGSLRIAIIHAEPLTCVDRPSFNPSRIRQSQPRQRITLPVEALPDLGNRGKERHVTDTPPNEMPS